MFCRESSSCLQTLNIAQNLSSLFPKPPALINRVSAGRRDNKLCRRPNLGGRCKVMASLSNIDQKGTKTKQTVKKIKVKGLITAEEGLLEGMAGSRPLDYIADIRGRSLLVELISAETDSRTGLAKDPVEDYAQRVWFKALEEKYECEFEIPEDFGTVGAIRVQNQHHREMFLKEMKLELPEGNVRFKCDSWLSSKSVDPAKRIFFSTKSYLPSETPEPLKKLRKEELETLKGENRERVGEFEKFERVYDYDVYNDVGNPDKDKELARPVIGGSTHPYPRRCKTGREPSDTDPFTEKRYEDHFYVPRDEEFSTGKGAAFTGKAILAALPSVFPQIESVLLNPNMPFY